MLLFIIRHAHAGQHGDLRYPNDDLRPLTKKGIKQFGRAVKKLAGQGFEPSLIATSPLVRCRQTADLVVEHLLVAPRLVELEALAPGSDLDELIAWSNAQQDSNLAWCGHAPDVSHFVAELIGSKSANITMAKGAIAAIEFLSDFEAGEGELLWLATPKIFGG